MARVPLEFKHWPPELAVEFGPYRAVVRHHVDGDTFDAMVDVGWNDFAYRPIRLLGVDCPETNRLATRDAGLAALAFVLDTMPVGARVRLHTQKDPDSFGRFLAKVELSDGTDLAARIIAAGHGTPA